MVDQYESQINSNDSKNSNDSNSSNNLNKSNVERSFNREDLLKNVSRVVVKVGTSSIIDDDGIKSGFFKRITEQVKHLMDSGIQVIIVSSGAIGVGLGILGIEAKPHEIPIRQAAAAVGQSELMHVWADAFEKHNLKVAQILLSYDFYSDRVKYLNLRNSIMTILSYGVVPIINENDSTCTNEIETLFGDNDRLSAMVSSKIEADLMIILSDVEGLYDRNPKFYCGANRIPIVWEITPEIESYGGDPSGTRGTGGMRTKLEAAKICEKSGCHMVIAHNEVPDVLIRLVNGEDIGTIFPAHEKRAKNKSRWLLLSKSEGTIHVDRGAMDALVSGIGLLPSGIYSVSGNFERGDIVRIECGGAVFAKGITDYSSAELDLIKGAQTNEIESILGHKNYDHVIRKENLAIYD
ncbi:MAG: glutamate 5-kinase [Methanosarcinaceae archaeon]|nr:glutamate 5-kinase [Methanosarcinaceae archaeon]